MSNTIQIKRSVLTATPPELLVGELAYSEDSDVLFIGETGNAVTPIGGSAMYQKVTGIATGADNYAGWKLAVDGGAEVNVPASQIVTFDAGTNVTLLRSGHSVTIAADNTWRPIHSTPEDGATTTSISSDWAFDNVKTAVPVSAVFTDTTYNVGDGGLTEINFTSADNTKLDGIASLANNYSHPSTPGTKHVPTGGATDEILKYISSGTAMWYNPYTAAHTWTAKQEFTLGMEVDGVEISAGPTPSPSFGGTDMLALKFTNESAVTAPKGFELFDHLGTPTGALQFTNLDTGLWAARFGGGLGIVVGSVQLDPTDLRTQLYHNTDVAGAMVLETVLTGVSIPTGKTLFINSFEVIHPGNANIGGSATNYAAGNHTHTIATQAQAEVGANNTDMMTPLRTAQAIAVLAAGLKNEYTKTVPPAATDDVNAGYSVGSYWIDITADEAYRCVDNKPWDGEVGAVWVKTTLDADDLGSLAFESTLDGGTF